MKDEFSIYERIRDALPVDENQKAWNDSKANSSQRASVGTGYSKGSGQSRGLSGPKRKIYRSSLGRLVNKSMTQQIEEVRASATNQRLMHFAVAWDPSDPVDKTFFRTVGPKRWYGEVFMAMEPFDEDSTNICAQGILSGRTLHSWERDRVSYEVFVNKNVQLLGLLSPSESWRKSHKTIRPLELLSKYTSDIDAVFSHLPEKSWMSLTSLYRTASVDPPLNVTQQIIRWLELQGSHHRMIIGQEMGICPDLNCMSQESEFLTKSEQGYESPWLDNLVIIRTFRERRSVEVQPVEIQSNGKPLGTFSQTNLGFVFSGKQTKIKTKYLDVEITRTFPKGKDATGTTTLEDKNSGQKRSFLGSFARAWTSPDTRILIFLHPSGEFVRVDATSGIHSAAFQHLDLGDLYSVEISFSENHEGMVVYSKKGHFTVFTKGADPRSYVLDFFPRSWWEEIENLLNTACPQDIDTRIPAVNAKGTSPDVFRFEILERLKKSGFTTGLTKLKKALEELRVSDSTLLLKPGMVDALKVRGVSADVIDGLSWCLHYSAVSNMDPLEVNIRVELAALQELGWTSFPVSRFLRIVPALRIQQHVKTKDVAFEIDFVSSSTKGWNVYFGHGFMLHLDQSATPVSLGVPFTANTLYGEDPNSLHGEQTQVIQLDSYALDPKVIKQAASYAHSFLLP